MCCANAEISWMMYAAEIKFDSMQPQIVSYTVPERCAPRNYLNNNLGELEKIII